MNGNEEETEANETQEEQENVTSELNDKGNYTISGDSCLTTEKLLSDSYMSDYMTSFNDIESASYKEAIMRLEKTEIVTGKEAGVFDPESEITRAEFLAIVLQVHCYDILVKPEILPFLDVDLASWQSNVIQTGLENNIIAGDVDEVGKRVFRPNDSISKIEAYAIIMNLRDIKLKEKSDTHSYTDAAADWQNEYLSTGESLGILIPAETDNIFSPNMKLNRDDLVGLMFKIMELY